MAGSKRFSVCSEKYLTNPCFDRWEETIVDLSNYHRLYHHQNKWRFDMDWNRVEGNWKQVKGKIKEKWGKLTDDDLNVINGRRDQLEGKIQERYGLARDQIRNDIDAWFSHQKW
jgi:uncharacterized protein YjbJ (UPF0337 family)